MAFDITDRAALESQKENVKPQLVLEIQGVDTFFGAVKLLRVIRIGDDGLLIGNSWKIGGLTGVENQADIVSFDGGTSTSINQQLEPDKGSVSSVSSVTIALTDRDLIATKLITPGAVVPDVLYRKAILWMGFAGTSFKEDFVPVFSGVIDDIQAGPGLVSLNIAAPEQLKRQEIFIPNQILIVASIDGTQTTIPVVDASSLSAPSNGPDGTPDPAIKYYVQIQDEIIRYTGISGNSLTGCSRGQLGSIAVAHVVSGDPITGKSAVSIEDTVTNVALKLMLSGHNGPYQEDVPVSQFLHPTPLETVPNAIFFYGIRLNRDFGTTVGDYITLTGSTAGNNFTAKRIEDIVDTDDGSYLVVADFTIVPELDPVAVVSFRSQFDTLGEGLGMTPDQVDVNEHIYWNNFQLSTFQYRFFIKEKINGKDFLDKEVYLPIGAFSLPRQGRCSMGYHIGPVIRGRLKIMNRDTIKDPDKLKLRRTTNRNFYNTVIYKYEKRATDDGFSYGYVEYSAESRNRIKAGNKPFTVESAGLRADLDGAGIAARASNRYLGRYKFAAEFFEAAGLLFRDGYSLEPGDSILLDGDQLNIANTADGTRNKTPKVFSVTNKKMNLKTGDITVALTDTNFDGTERYGVVSPSSEIVSGTTTSLLIRDSFGALYPGNESRKWADYVGMRIIVHSDDWTYAEEVTLLEIDPSNKYKLNLDPATPLSGAPVDGYVIDIANYPSGTDPNENAHYKAVHAFLGATVPVVAGIDESSFTVDAGDVGKFTVGSDARIHNLDFDVDGGEVKIKSIVGTTITIEPALAFTLDDSYVVEGLDFPDGGKTYRIF